MSVKEIIHRAFMAYFILFTLITAVIAIIGNAFDPNANFGYEAFLYPFKYTAFGVLPVVIMYSSNELSTKQYIIRKIVQLAAVEAEILIFTAGNAAADTDNTKITLSIMASVFIVFVSVHIISAVNDYFSAKKLTNELMEFQRKENNAK